MANVAVTGASGFIGSNLVCRLREEGHTVVEVGHRLRDGALQGILAGTDLVGATVTRLVVRIESCTFVAGDPHSHDITGTLIVMGTLD